MNIIPANRLDAGIPANQLMAIMCEVCQRGDYYPLADGDEWRHASNCTPECEHSIQLARHPRHPGYCLLMVSDHADDADRIVHAVDCYGGLYTYRV